MDFMQTLPDIVRMLLALALVVAMMGGLAAALKHFGLTGERPLKTVSKRLKIVERLQLDARRQLVLIERDDAQHLIILGHNGEAIVETNITTGEPADESA